MALKKYNLSPIGIPSPIYKIIHNKKNIDGTIIQIRNILGITLKEAEELCYGKEV